MSGHDIQQSIATREEHSQSTAVDQEKQHEQLGQSGNDRNPESNDSSEATFPQLSTTKSVLLVAVISSAGLLMVLNVQSVVIMLPSIGEDLLIPASRQQLVVSVYNISSGCLMLLWGRLADVYGRRLVFLVGSALFTLSTMCLPFSLHEIAFYVLRVLQGMSGAAMLPSGIGIITTTFAPGPVRNRAYVALSAVASLGSIAGNLIGGVIGGFLSWKWVFWIPAILAAVTTAITFVVTSMPELCVRPVQADKKPYVDWLGAMVISTGLILLLVALTEGNIIGWATPWIPTVIVVSLLLLLLFIYLQGRLEKDPERQPLIRVSIFKNQQFSALLVLVGCFYAAFNTFSVFATYFYQDYLGLSVLQTTLRFLPAGITGVIISFAVPPAITRISSFHILFFGLSCGLTSPLLFALPVIPPSTSYWAYGFPAMALCMSIEIIWPVAGLLISKRLPQEDQALGGGMLQTVQNVGRSLGLAIATAVQTGAEGGSGIPSTEQLRGLRAGQWVNVGLVGFAMVIAVVYFRKMGKF